MDPSPQSRTPLLAFGMASLVLGFLGTLLFFLPILGVPIALCGFICGMIGLISALLRPDPSLRWALGGIALSLIALGVDLALMYAPDGYHLTPRQPSPWQPPRDRPYVAPPA
jgi:hypothetical protein